MDTLSRRRFAQALVGFSAGLSWTGNSLLAEDAADNPVTETTSRPSHFKLSLAAYSFRQYLTGDSPKMSLDDFIRFCADQNLDGCELTSYYFPKDFGNDYLIHLKQLTFRLGLDVSGTAIGNDFCHPDGEKRDEQLALTRKWIDAAALFGAPVIRIFAGNVRKGLTEEEAIQNCVRGIEESLKYAADKGVILALENHGGITATPEQMLKIVRAIPANPWFGVNFDSGNFRTAEPYADLEQIAPYAVNAQVKVEMFPNGKKAPADLERIVSILKAARYRGYVVLEYEADEDPVEAVPGHLKTLRGLIGR